MRLPWAEVRARFTALFERLAIDVLKETDITVPTTSMAKSASKTPAEKKAADKK